MLDVHAKLLTYLKTKSTLLNAISSRIFVIDLPEKIDFPAIVFKKDGGEDKEPLLEISFEFLVYADSDIEADLIDGYLRDALQTTPSISIRDYSINRINNDIMGQPVEFPDYDAIKIRQSFYTVVFINE